MVGGKFIPTFVGEAGLMSGEEKTTGGCLCGAVRYEAIGEPMQVAHCHCEECRRSTGAAFATGVCFPVETVTWTQEEPISYKSSDSFARLFCSHCGSSVAQHNLSTGTMWPLVGTLDHPESVAPECHMFTKEQITWIKLNDGLPRHQTFPPIGEAQQEDRPAME
jgi:hypothetical protein